MQLGARYSFFETMSSSSCNLIEILAESFNIYFPDINTLKAEAFEDTEGLVEYLLTSTKQDQSDSVEEARKTI